MKNKTTYPSEEAHASLTFQIQDCHLKTVKIYSKIFTSIRVTTVYCIERKFWTHTIKHTVFWKMHFL